MPGWWYTVESMTPKHLTHQFKSAIHDALASSSKTRAMMRACSAKQRFPVAQWVEDLDTLQSTAIKISEEENYERSHSFVERGLKSPSMTNLRTLFSGGHGNSSQVSIRHVSNNSLLSPGTPSSPWTPKPNAEWTPMPPRPRSPSPANSPGADELLLPRPIFAGDSESINKRFSTLSYDSVAGGREDFALQKVDPSFTDATGAYLKAFEKKLEGLDPKSSENLLCIEENLIKSEKSFFKEYRDAKMGHTPATSRAPSLMGSRPSTPVGSFFEHSAHGSVESVPQANLLNDFSLGRDYTPPTGLRRFLLYRVGDWPVYSILLAFGQIIAANSYQITLLIGEVGETAIQLYIIASIYAASSMMWWLLFRTFKSVYCLSIPFAFYGCAFFLIGMAPFAGSFARGVSVSPMIDRTLLTFASGSNM